MSSALRDALRAKIFAAKRSSTLVPIGTPAEGEEPQFVEVVQPSVGEMMDQASVANPRQRVVRMMISTVFVPGTNEKVFEEADYDSLLELPADNTYSKLMEAITSSIDSAKQGAEAKKP